MVATNNWYNTKFNKKGKKIMASMRKLGALVIGMMAFGTVANAQDNVEASVSADIVSKYIWRGQELGNAAIQPTAQVSYKGLSLTAWGSYGLVEKGEEEFDLTLAYSVGGFNIGVTDYFCSSTAKYFEYSANSTAHTFEANIGYDFGPLSVQWYTNFAGSDGANNSGNRAYSSYVELNAPFKLGDLDWNATVGAVPYATDFYADATGFAVTNVSLKASKDIKVTDTFTLPVFAAINANPSNQKAYFTFGVTLVP